jgi:hypothetical protein
LNEKGDSRKKEELQLKQPDRAFSMLALSNQYAAAAISEIT